MTDPIASAVPSSADPASVEQLGGLLFDALYTEDAIASVLRVRDRSLWRDKKLPLYVRRASERTPLHVFIRLFILGVEVDASDAAAAFAPMTVESLEAMGLIERAGDAVAAKVALSPHKGLVVAHDPWSAAAPDFPDSVPGLAPSPLWLDEVTLRRRAGSTLDVGAGSGIQALLAARHSDRVVATDVNGRSVEFCIFNARLNGIDHLTALRGDLFEPVRDERFDLIVCNPPYVVSPESEYLYRDGGHGQDSFSARLLRELPGHLRDGGYACVEMNWPLAEGEDWSDPVRRWIEGSGCDALILLDGRLSPLSYAADMNSDLAADPVAYERALETWTSYYRAEGIHRIVACIVVLRRRPASRNWVEALAVPGSHGGAGDHIEAMFEARTGSQDRRPGDLLRLYPRLAEGAELREQVTVPGDGPRELTHTLRRISGFGFVEGISASEWELLRRCDGSRPLGELLDGPAWAEPDAREALMERLGSFALSGLIRLDTRG